MTQDDIRKLAREAGLHLATDVNWMPIIGLEYAGKFAKLVLMNTDPNSFMSYQEGAEAGRLAEREACAKLCADNGLFQTCEAIRARGNT
jgi:hypothetical protein